MVFFNSLLLMPTWDAARKLRFIFSTGVLSKANNHLVASKLDSQSMVDHIHKVVWSMKLKIYLYWNLIRSQLWLAEFWLYFALIFLPSIDIILWNFSERHNFPQKTSTQNKEKKKEKKIHKRLAGQRIFRVIIEMKKCNEAMPLPLNDWFCH